MLVGAITALRRREHKNPYNLRVKWGFPHKEKKKKRAPSQDSVHGPVRGTIFPLLHSPYSSHTLSFTPSLAHTPVVPFSPPSLALVLSLFLLVTLYFSLLEPPSFLFPFSFGCCFINQLRSLSRCTRRPDRLGGSLHHISIF